MKLSLENLTVSVPSSNLRKPCQNALPKNATAQLGQHHTSRLHGQVNTSEISPILQAQINHSTIKERIKRGGRVTAEGVDWRRMMGGRGKGQDDGCMFTRLSRASPDTPSPAYTTQSQMHTSYPFQLVTPLHTLQCHAPCHSHNSANTNGNRKRER